MSSLLIKKRCDVCGIDSETIVDARTKPFGQWAWMCEDCWKRHGLYDSFGVGKGQRFVNEDGGEKLDG
jgi:hypothetical protein